MENTLTKLSFSFTPEDMEALAAVKAKLLSTQGKVSNIVAIRVAIRQAAKA